jgi:glutamine synthetase
MASLLANLPALLAIGSPSPSSYLRLQPSRWAGAFQVWGYENREAAIRFIAGTPADRAAANVEIKCFDLSANPYLLVGAVMAVALDGAAGYATLPPEVIGDPAAPGHPLAETAARLPDSLPEALAALLDSDILRAAAGDELINTYAASRRAELALCDGKKDADVIAHYRWLI